MKNIDESKIIKKVQDDSPKATKPINKEPLIDNSKEIKSENNVKIKIDNLLEKPEILEKPNKKEPAVKPSVKKPTTVINDPIIEAKSAKNTELIEKELKIEPAKEEKKPIEKSTKSIIESNKPVIEPKNENKLAEPPAKQNKPIVEPKNENKPVEPPVKQNKPIVEPKNENKEKNIKQDPKLIKPVAEVKKDKPVFKSTNKQIIEKEEQKVEENKNSMPIFNGEIKNGKVQITSQRKPVNNFNYNKRPNINVNAISSEQLRIAKINTLKAINDINIDISILISLIAQNDEYYEFYNNKLIYLKNELNYLNQKKLYIERMLRE